jgi:hypothetical protein
MAQEFEPLPPITPIEEPRRRSNTTLVVVIIILLLLCCCCALLAAGYWLWINGDMLLEQMQFDTFFNLLALV